MEITADWLKTAGFRKTWTGDRSAPHDVLWLGDSRRTFASSDDLGLELSEPQRDSNERYCWLRSDSSHSYGRFLFVRYVRSVDDLVKIIEAITGEPWDASRVSYGCWRYSGQRIESSTNADAVARGSEATTS